MGNFPLYIHQSGCSIIIKQGRKHPDIRSKGEKDKERKREREKERERERERKREREKEREREREREINKIVIDTHLLT